MEDFSSDESFYKKFKNSKKQKSHNKLKDQVEVFDEISMRKFGASESQNKPSIDRSAQDDDADFINDTIKDLEQVISEYEKNTKYLVTASTNEKITHSQQQPFDDSSAEEQKINIQNHTASEKDEENRKIIADFKERVKLRSTDNKNL